MDFWENVLRYPRFFLSSCLGLVFVILSPFRQFTKTKFSTLLIILFLSSIILFIIFTLKLMLETD